MDYLILHQIINKNYEPKGVAHITYSGKFADACISADKWAYHEAVV